MILLQSRHIEIIRRMYFVLFFSHYWWIGLKLMIMFICIFNLLYFKVFCGLNLDQCTFRAQMNITSESIAIAFVCMWLIGFLEAHQVTPSSTISSYYKYEYIFRKMGWEPIFNKHYPTGNTFENLDNHFYVLFYTLYLMFYIV